MGTDNLKVTKKSKIVQTGNELQTPVEVIKPETMLVSPEATNDVAVGVPDFVKIEKNLTALGFFTPSSNKSLKNINKTVSFNQMVEGKKVEAKVTIAPMVEGELPSTGDQDKYVAFLKLLDEIKQSSGGKISNPIAFSSYELMQILGIADSGVHYAEIEKWLRIMTTTSVISEGAVYLADKKVWASDIFHVFSRAVSVGRDLPDGTVADKNYVWLSEWQLENINQNHLLPVDFDSYKKLRNHISKALVPLLQIWLYASSSDGSFEKRYDELCQYLNIKQHCAPSVIRQQLKPSLDELVQLGYLSSWEVERTTARRGPQVFKVIFRHGPKFYDDRVKRLTQKSQAEQPRKRRRKPQESNQPTLFSSVDDSDVSSNVVEHTEPIRPRTAKLTKKDRMAEASTDAAVVPPLKRPEEAWIEALTRRGVLDTEARKLVSQLSADQPVLEQLEYLDRLISASEGGIKNPPGFYVALIRENITLPEDFELVSERGPGKTIGETEEDQLFRYQRLQLEYDTYRTKTIDEYIAAHISPEELTKRQARRKVQYLSQNPQAARWLPEALENFVQDRVRDDIAHDINLVSEDEFCASGGLVLVNTNRLQEDDS